MHDVSESNTGFIEPIVIFVLWHIHEFEEQEDDSKLIGVYSSEQRASEAVERLKMQLGFDEHPDRFHIDHYTLDQDNWVEGFVTVCPDDPIDPH